MRSSHPSAPRCRTAGWPRAVLLTTVLLGILGMHVLAAHCSPSGSHPGDMPVVSMEPLQADDDGPTAMGAFTPPSGAHSSDMSDQGGGGHDLGMVGMCIAALAGLALALAVALGRKSRPWWRVSPRVRLSQPPLLTRIPRPPTLAELSLLRC